MKKKAEFIQFSAVCKDFKLLKYEHIIYNFEVLDQETRIWTFIYFAKIIYKAFES